MTYWWVISVFTSLVFCAAAGVALKRYGVVDRPNQRSSHTIPTIRGGGIGIVLSWPTLLMLAYGVGFEHNGLSGVVLLALGLSLVSFFDDINPLPASVRFLVHSAVAIGGLIFVGVEGIHWTLLLISFLFIAGYTNAFNFMDGINGLAASQTVITGLGTAAIAILVEGHSESFTVLLSLVLSGSAVGFLPYNFPRARMFMGDVSSASIGYVLAMLAMGLIYNHGVLLVVPFLCIHANFILDTGITLLKRILRGENIKAAHRSHFYQLLVRSGWSHTKVTSFEIGLQGLIILSVVLNMKTGLIDWYILGLLVVLSWCLTFCYIQRVFNRNINA